jgi:hypothetical protein
MVRSYFLIQLSILCPLIREVRPLTFIITIERYVVFPVILLFLLFLLFSYPSFANLLAYWSLFFPVFS